MLIQGNNYAHEPSRRIVWLHAAQPLLQVLPPAINLDVSAAESLGFSSCPGCTHPLGSASGEATQDSCENSMHASGQSSLVLDSFLQEATRKYDGLSMIHLLFMVPLQAVL